MRIMTESDLIRKAHEGDEASFSSIIEEHESDLRGVAFKILKDDDDVDDAMQAVRIKVWEKIGTFDPGKGAKLSTWLHTITKRTCLDQIKKHKVGTSETEKKGEEEQENEAEDKWISPTGKKGWIEHEEDPRNILLVKEGEQKRAEMTQRVRERGKRVTALELQHIHIEPANWRLKAEGNLRKSLRNRKDPRYLKEALRILSSPDIDIAILHLCDAGGLTNNDLVNLILVCVPSVFPHRFTKKDAADLAAAIRLVRKRASSLLTPDRKAIDDRIKFFDELATRRVPPGPKGSKMRLLISLLSRNFRRIYGPDRPVHGATAALLRATFPRSKWTAARVAETIARRKGPADLL